jgi:hypothetical protein
LEQPIKAKPIGVIGPFVKPVIMPPVCIFHTLEIALEGAKGKSQIVQVVFVKVDVLVKPVKIKRTTSYAIKYVEIHPKQNLKIK